MNWKKDEKKLIRFDHNTSLRYNNRLSVFKKLNIKKTELKGKLYAQKDIPTKEETSYSCAWF